MAVTLAPGEARRDTLSGQAQGGAIVVDTDYTASSVADTTVVHHVTTGVVDSVWVQAHNSGSSTATLYLVVNPSDDTSSAAVDAVTVAVDIPSRDSLWVLQGDALRLRGSNTSTIRAYTSTSVASAGELHLTGYVVRAQGASIY